MTVDRRGFLVAAAAALGAVVQDSLAGSGPAGKVWDPSRAGRNMAPITAGDVDAGIQAIEKKLRCTCGCGLDIYTCRTTDFTCTYSPALHKQVLDLVASGKTGQDVLDAFVAQYGQQALMAPPMRGFNLAGYWVPSLAVLVAGGFLVRAIRRWTRATAAEAAAVPASARSSGLDATPAELERLRRELERLPN